MPGNADRPARFYNSAAIEPKELDAPTDKQVAHFVHREAPDSDFGGQCDLPNERHRQRIVDVYLIWHVISECVEIPVEANIQPGEISSGKAGRCVVRSIKTDNPIRPASVGSSHVGDINKIAVGRDTAVIEAINRTPTWERSVRKRAQGRRMASKKWSKGPVVTCNRTILIYNDTTKPFCVWIASVVIIERDGLNQ